MWVGTSHKQPRMEDVAGQVHGGIYRDLIQNFYAARQIADETTLLNRADEALLSGERDTSLEVADVGTGVSGGGRAYVVED